MRDENEGHLTGCADREKIERLANMAKTLRVKVGRPKKKERLKGFEGILWKKDECGGPKKGWSTNVWTTWREVGRPRGNRGRGKERIDVVVTAGVGYEKKRQKDGRPVKWGFL